MKNKKFIKNLFYFLFSLFCFLDNFTLVISQIYDYHLENEEVLIKIGEVLFYIVSNFSHTSKLKEFEIFKNYHGVSLIKEILDKLPSRHIEANKIYLKIFHVILEIIQRDQNFNIEENFSIILALIEKFNDNADLMVYLFETLKKISSIKKFKEIVNSDFLESLFKIISMTSSHKIATLGLQILDIIVKTIDSREIIRSSKPISLVVRLLKKFKDDNLLSFHACGFLSKVLEKEDVYVFLKIMKIRNLKSDLFNIDSIFNEVQFGGGLTEIKEMITNQDEESFSSLKKNITRVLILMSKDKNFLQLLHDINSLDIFVSLLKSDLEIYSANFSENKKENDEIYVIEHILPDLLRLILSLLKHYEVDYEIFELNQINNYQYPIENTRSSITSHRKSSIRISLTNRNTITKRNSINNTVNASRLPQKEYDAESFYSESSNNQTATMKDIYYCLFKSLFFFCNDKKIVYEVLEYLSNNEKKLIEEMIREFDPKEVVSALTKLFKIYYDCKWLYVFIYKIFQGTGFLIISNTGNTSTCEEDIVLMNIRQMNKIVESISLVYEDNKKDLLIKLLNETSLYLIFNNNLNSSNLISTAGVSNHQIGFNYNDNTFQEFVNFSHFLLNYLHNLHDNEKSEKKEVTESSSCLKSISEMLNPLLTLIFTSYENKIFGASNNDEKSKLVILSLKKLSSNENTLLLYYKYILLRLNRLIELKVENTNKLIFNDEFIIDFIINVINIIKLQPKIEESITKDCLNVLFFILQFSDTLLISRFLRENGLNLIMSICLNGVYDFDLNKLIISIIQSFSRSHFKESALIFKNFLAFRNFINGLKTIKFSKGVNEKIYWEILYLLNNIIKSCEYYEAVEETNLIDHLVNEYNEIYCFYLDTHNRILEIISEIFSLFSKERNLLKGLLNSKLPKVMENILKNISESNSTDTNDKIIEHLMNIFISFFKFKEYSKLIYNNYKVSLDIIKNIIFTLPMSENCLNKLLQLCHLLVEYENSDVVKDKIITQVFLRELSLKIPSNQKNHKEMVEKCLMLIENPFFDKMRKTINESNSKFIRELSDLVKADRKNAIKKRDGSSISSIASSRYQPRESNCTENEYINDQSKQDTFDQPENYHYNKRRSLININDNPKLKVHFENILNQINTICDNLNDPDRNELNIETESEQLSDLLKMLCLFAKNEDNIKKISDSNILEKLIFIMEDNNNLSLSSTLNGNNLNSSGCNGILTFAKDQGFILIEKLIEDEDFLNKLYLNGRACQFFLKELNKIGKLYFPDTSEFIRHKVFIVTKIIFKLSCEKLFVVNNNDYLSVSNIFNMLNLPSIQCDKEITLNILSIFSNIISFTPSNEISILNLKISQTLHNIWKRYMQGEISEIRVVEKIMKIIENLYLEENIIRDLLEMDLVELINEVFRSSKTDSEGVLNLLNMIDILMFYRQFVSKIIEQKFLTYLINAIIINMFNTKIVEKSLSIFLKGAKLDKSYITILGVYGIKEVCLSILSKYMTTCHSTIIKSTQELIFILISDENNLSYFSRGESMDILLKTFKINLKNKDHVLLSLKLINVITTKDVELKLDKARDKRNSLRVPSNPIKSTIVKISSVSSEGTAITYDFTILIEIINEILYSYDEYIDIIMQLCELINNIFNISNEIWLKKFMMDVIVNNADKYLTKHEYVQLFLNTMYSMIKSDKVILDLDCSSILYYISKISNIKLNYVILLTILKILKSVSRSKNINVSSNLTEMMKIMKFIEESKNFHDDDVILLFSQILGCLCVNTSIYKEISNDFIIFLIECLNSKNVNDEIYSKLLEDLKNISVYFHIKDEESSMKISKLVYSTFKANISNLSEASEEKINSTNSNQSTSNKKNLMNIFQIISSFCIQSEYMKIALNEIKFNEELKTLLNKDSLDDTLLDYQAKGCLLNLKMKKNLAISSKLTNSSTLRSMSIVISHVEVKDEVKFYLKTERTVKVYTDKGESKERIICMNESLTKISAYLKKKNNLEIFDEMDLKEMDSCVRSCGTAAFSKAKGIFTKSKLKNNL
jgi:hypothetical protein